VLDAPSMLLTIAATVVALLVIFGLIIWSIARESR
jgi:hypothetical protein